MLSWLIAFLGSVHTAVGLSINWQIWTWQKGTLYCNNCHDSIYKFSVSATILLKRTKSQKGQWMSRYMRKGNSVSSCLWSFEHTCTGIQWDRMSSYFLKLPLVPYILREQHCAGLPEPLLFAYVESTFFTGAGSFTSAYAKTGFLISSQTGRSV